VRKLRLQEWQDERLTWDPADFGNLTDIIVRADKLWLPELAVMNGSVALLFTCHFITAYSQCRYGSTAQITKVKILRSKLLLLSLKYFCI